MRRTSTLQASAAAFGLMAGFAMAPDVSSPLSNSVSPYAVAVVWRVSGPPETSVAGVEADDWGGRMAPTPAPAADAPRTNRAPQRATPRPRVRVHHRAPAAKPTPHKAGHAPRPVVRDLDLVAATFGVDTRECPRQAARTRQS